MGIPHTKLAWRVLCRKKYMPTSTPTEPPKADTIKKVFSLIRHWLCLDLYLSLPIKMKARALSNAIVQKMNLKESILIYSYSLKIYGCCHSLSSLFIKNSFSIWKSKQSSFDVFQHNYIRFWLFKLRKYWWIQYNLVSFWQGNIMGKEIIVFCRK